MELNDERIFTFNIHLILMNIIRKALQNSLEIVIINKNNCIYSDHILSNCQCISAFLESIEKNGDKNSANDVISHISKFSTSHNYYPNCLEIFDLTSLNKIANNFLKLIDKNNSMNIVDINEIKDDFIIFPRSIDTIRNIRNIYYAHMDDYKTKKEKYDKIIEIFRKILNNLNLSSDQVFKFNNQIDFILNKNQTDYDVDSLKKSILDENRFRLKSDVINFSEETNYIKRNEDEIIDKLLDKTNHKNKLILTQIVGSGKTTMARYISKRLSNRHNFIVKWFESDSIESNYEKILKEEFGYHFIDNDQIIKCFNDEISRELVKLGKGNMDSSSVLFIIDNVKYKEDILKYDLNKLPNELKILLTTSLIKEDLVDDSNQIDIIEIELLNKQHALSYLMNLRKNFKTDDELNNYFDKILENQLITPLKLKQIFDIFVENKKMNLIKIKEKIIDLFAK